MSKTKKIGAIAAITLAAFVVAFFTYGAGEDTGKAEATVELEGKKVLHDELASKISELENEVQEYEKQIEGLKADFESEEARLSDKQKEVDEALALVKGRDELESKVDALNKDIKEKEGKAEDVTATISEKEAELEALENGIKKKQEEPLELLSGTWIVGIDFPPGRYQATNVGEGSNFVVYSSSGSLKVNTILGDDWGYGDHVFFAEEGDEIETGARVKLIPVE